MIDGPRSWEGAHCDGLDERVPTVPSSLGLPRYSSQESVPCTSLHALTPHRKRALRARLADTSVLRPIVRTGSAVASDKVMPGAFDRGGAGGPKLSQWRKASAKSFTGFFSQRTGGAPAGLAGRRSA